MVGSMKENFDKYWGDAEDINHVFFLAIVLDPRYKIGYLKYCFECVYDAESVARIVMKVESLLQRMYTAYDDHVPHGDGLKVSTVASESAFSTSGHILDPFRSSLSPKLVEALVCTQSWLKGQQGGLKLDSYVDETNSYQFIEEENADQATEKNKTVTKNIHIIDKL
ncbi:hypothetical protein POM88_026554 [Heracleum sosnowskyi]|uniref:Uncharacterized protein n=1 Tax=Heracleum sosnowskyi TaxID=360622 RepID=A0AAD8I9E0_9APIA|nr:hypothetical protein POM88_026554 [Heracleum sosnowskyi]